MRAKMFAKIVIWFVVINVISAQFNGEFWWLNDKIAKFTGASPPKFENLTEFDTDESAKIIFRDNDLSIENDKKEYPKNKAVTKDGKMLFEVHFQDRSEIVWPTNFNEDLSDPNEYKPLKNEPMQNVHHNNLTNNSKNITQVSEDILEFKFPEEDNFVWKDKTNTISVQTTTDKNIVKDVNKIYFIEDKVPVKVQEKEPYAENICTMLSKYECDQRNGIVYTNNKRVSKKFVFETQIICCILPIAADNSSKIHFVDTKYKITKRHKRSNENDNLSSALKQRNALMMRKFSTNYLATKASPTTQSKIVTNDEDYVDPYANIKNSNFKAQTSQKSLKQTIPKHYYGATDYAEDYTIELPKPGLVGIYSDHAGSPSWSFANNENGNGNTRPLYGGTDDSLDYDQPSFGYGATVDPRIVNRLGTTEPPTRIKPAKLSLKTASSEEQAYDAESQTIGYHSNPDFHVLHGFKLLNLVRNRSKIYKNGKKSTTPSVFNNDSKESVLLDKDTDIDYEDLFDTDQQAYPDCGKAKKQLYENFDNGRKTGDAESGSHPWLTLVVLTRKQQTILCYATLIHQRAAVTTADCIHGRVCPGEITLIAGAWNLNDEPREGWQKRMASVSVHPEYEPGKLANNLAVLYWKRPLRVGVNVQPACLSDPHVGDACMFVGWGGYDQAITPQSRWQRASILTPRACKERFSSADKRETVPSDAFCADVQSRGTVTGVGGPLMCVIGSRHAAVGVAVWRDHAVLLQPARHWTLHTLKELNIQ